MMLASVLLKISIIGLIRFMYLLTDSSTLLLGIIVLLTFITVLMSLIHLLSTIDIKRLLA